MTHKDLLFRIRNDLPLPIVIAALGRDGPLSKRSEGRFRFACPYCGEMQAIVNPRNNLAHCFACSKNTNNIDLMMSLGYDFRTTVAILQQWLERHESRMLRAPTTQEAT
jgi:DNA primase